jgi:hypothetical protein
MPKTVEVKVNITIPDGVEVNVEDIPTLISSVIDVGINDAYASCQDDDLYTEDAEMICSLIIGYPTL